MLEMRVSQQVSCWFTSLAFSPSGQPYVAYQDYLNSYKATVMTFDGTNWVNVGNAGFSAAKCLYKSCIQSIQWRPLCGFWG